MVSDHFQPRDIVLHWRNDQLTKVAETRRYYDALQYPIIFWDGGDEYHFNVKMINPVSGEETNMKCSAMNYYSYRLMIRENEDNHILKRRQVFHQTEPQQRVSGYRYYIDEGISKKNELKGGRKADPPECDQ
jgi:hypothetical protein